MIYFYSIFKYCSKSRHFIECTIFLLIMSKFYIQLNKIISKANQLTNNQIIIFILKYGYR